jgi:aconitate hydratase
VKPVAILSGNRNFPGRVHPDLELSFIMSPPLVVAFALAGDAERDLSASPVQVPAGRHAVYLHDLWPTREEIDAPGSWRGQRSRRLPPRLRHRQRDPVWRGVKAPDGARYPWDPASTILRRPPFAAP